MNKWIRKFFKNISMNKVTINGKTITTTGAGSVSIINGEVFINGKKQDTGDAKEINISIEGNVEKLKAQGCNTVSVSGDVTSLSTSSGDVEVEGNVLAGIQCSSGDVEVEGDVSGSIKTSSGDVKCGRVAGDVKTMSGNIRHKK